MSIFHVKFYITWAAVLLSLAAFANASPADCPVNKQFKPNINMCVEIQPSAVIFEPPSFSGPSTAKDFDAPVTEATTRKSFSSEETDSAGTEPVSTQATPKAEAMALLIIAILALTTAFALAIPVCRLAWTNCSRAHRYKCANLGADIETGRVASSGQSLSDGSASSLGYNRNVSLAPANSDRPLPSIPEETPIVQEAQPEEEPGGREVFYQLPSDRPTPEYAGLSAGSAADG